ncbi:MAG: T9SS type A sorting domain-containing protein [Melioribacteraceae bacterium]|nr:T9SS type A sorting domain-containing protein [Melioribacteraceae bacterium]MCF8355134.1 T9SS type A sorting domain-containing protein [Melioribacteraceae bacterium]MCF8392389.1 T9SS type A sorting domain-containing protein [Melioribacteraceae bacterium]MCF8417910.1 T9SS type A sorting domain-containing protein [Melioribacteraceae bacterium]
MKSMFFVMIVCFNYLFGQTWENIGPGAGSDLHFSAIKPDNADVIYVGGDIEGIFKTTDGGNTWRNINNNIAHTDYSAGVYWTNDIVIDPVNYERVYYCSGVGLFLSDNGGDHWELIYPSNYLPDDEAVSVSTIAIDPTNNDRIIIGLGDGAVGSYADFEPFEDFDQPTGMFKSTDGGSTWDEINIPIPAFTNIHSIIIVPNSPEKIIVSTSKGIYKSTDNGVTWQSSNTGLPHSNTHRIFGKSFDTDFILYLTLKTLGDTADPNSFEGGIFKSADLGNNWIDITGNLPKYSYDTELFFEYWQLDVHPSDPDLIVTGTTRGSSYDSSGVFATYDGGDSWTQIYYPVIGGWMEDWFFDPYVYDIKIAPSDPDRWVMILVDVEISSDAGATWQQAFTEKIGEGWKGNGLELMNTETIAFHSTDPNTFWIGYDDMGLFRTDDNGNSFIRLDPQMDPTIGNLSEIDAVKDIEVDQVNNDLYISRYQGSQGGYLADYTNGGIVFSGDLGDTQVEKSTGLPEGRCDLVLDKLSGETGNRILYTAVFHYGVYKSTNSGADWFQINNGLAGNAEFAWEIAIDPNNSQILYLGLNSRGAEINGLYKSTDAGLNWQLLSNFPAGDVLAIHINSLGVYASVTDNFDWDYSGGLYFSSDGGSSWINKLEHSRIADIRSVPGNANTLLAAGQQWYRLGGEVPALFISDDGGDNWTNLISGLNHTFINTAVFDPNNSINIFVCTAGGGLWKSEDATSVKEKDVVQNNFRLYQNYPNPFNPTTTINFSLPSKEIVKLQIYDMLGREVNTLLNNEFESGEHNIVWDGTDNAGNKLSSGVYLYRLTAGNFIKSHKMIYLK